MRFSLSDLQALSFIDTDLPQLVIKKFLAAIIQYQGQVLFFIISKMRNATMDLATGAKIVIKLWLRFLTKYHEKNWEAKSILF